MTCLFAADDNVWKEVSEMDDKVTVRYDLIEELFCQKTATVATVSYTHLTLPTKVNV